MHLADIDYMAIHQKSIFHQSKPLIKTIFVFSLMGILLFSSTIEKSIGVLVILLLLSMGAKISFPFLFHLLAYPLFFGGLFSLMVGGIGTKEGVILLLRAIGVAWTFLFLLLTTPYSDIFRVFSFFMPTILIDIFLLTYRSVFILLDSVENMFQSIRLRGGFHPGHLLRNFKNFSKMLGVVFLYAMEMSERMYQIYALRGYEGKLPVTKESEQRLTIGDVLLILIGMGYGIGMVIL